MSIWIRSIAGIIKWALINPNLMINLTRPNNKKPIGTMLIKKHKEWQDIYQNLKIWILIKH